MVFKIRELSDEEATKWAKYFSEKYPEHGCYLGNYLRWTSMVINEKRTIFLKKDNVNRDDPHQISLFYFWRGQLFSVRMRQVWGEDDLEAWDFERLVLYSDISDMSLSSESHLPDEFKNDKEKFFQDFKEAIIVYGRYGGNISNPPIPNIKIRVGGKLY